MLIGSKCRFIYSSLKPFQFRNIKYFIDVSDEKIFKKVKDEFVIKNDRNEINQITHGDELVEITDRYLTTSSKVYYDLLEEHAKFRIPFSDEEFYKNLLKFSSKIMNNSDLESWSIIEKYAILNMDRINMEFLIEIIEELSKKKSNNFEFWYLSEKRVLKNLEAITNHQLATLTYHLAISNSCSNHLFDLLSEDVLNRGLRNFNEVEFKYIFDGFKHNRIKVYGHFSIERR